MTAIAFQYPEELRAIREGLAAFLEAEVYPRHERHAALLDDENRRYTDDGRLHPDVLRLVREIREAAAKAGYYAMCAPRSIGGEGLGHLAWFAAWEQIFHRCGGRHWLGEYVVAHWAFGPSRVLERLTPEARERALPALIGGSAAMCFGMSEPDAGSDATMMRTRAEREGDGWRLNGSKIWTTNSPYAEYCIVFAVTDPEQAAKGRGAGISAFLVPTSSPGFVVQRVIRLWGHNGGNEAVLAFDDVRIEPYQLVGELHKGFAIAMLGVNLGRLFNSARAVGLARWALERGFEYAKVRNAFGHPIAEYQGVTFPLAESATEIHAAHLMALNVAQLLDAGEPARKELSMTKGFATQAGLRALDRVIQAHGAIGMTNELHLSHAYLTLRAVNIADGSNQILWRAISKEMLGGDVEL